MYTMSVSESWMHEQHDALASFIKKVADDPSLQAKLEADDSDPVSLANELGISLEAKALEMVFGASDEKSDRELKTEELATVSGGFGFKLSGKNFMKGLNISTKTISKGGFNMAGTSVVGCNITYPTCCSCANGFDAMANISQKKF